MQATNLKTNHLVVPLSMDDGPLFLSWQCVGGVQQTAYEIEVIANGTTVQAPPPGILSAQGIHRAQGGRAAVHHGQGPVCGMAERCARRRDGTGPRQLYR